MSLDDTDRKIVGAELAALTEENSKLRAEVHALREEISTIYDALSAIEQITRLLAANSMLTNLEKIAPLKVETKSLETKSARGKIPVLGIADMSEFVKDTFIEVATSRKLPAEFIATRDTNYSADTAVFILGGSMAESDVINFKNLVTVHKKILLVVDYIIGDVDDFGKCYHRQFVQAAQKYHLDWNKVFVVYVDLISASKAQRINDFEFFQRSNFPEVEKFFQS